MAVEMADIGEGSRRIQSLLMQVACRCTVRTFILRFVLPLDSAHWHKLFIKPHAMAHLQNILC